MTSKLSPTAYATLAVVSIAFGGCSGGGSSGGFAAAGPDGSAAAGGSGGTFGSGGTSGDGGGGGSVSGSGGTAGGGCAELLITCDGACVDSQSNADHCGSCAVACGATEVCVAGSCSALPSACPCPLESYCDIAANTCKPGCLGDEDCSAGRYCDTIARECKPGCRNSDECPTAETCVNHVCTNTCPNCDDANPCTIDGCVKGQCTNQPGNEGGACADDTNPCTANVCKSGQCTHPPINEGGGCPNTPCNQSSTCKAGTCTGTPLTDGTVCGGTDFDRCLSGQCLSVKALCSTMQAQGDNYIYSSWEEPSGATGTQIYYSCQCPTSTSMKSDWPPGATGIGGTKKYWSCQSCKSIAKSDPYAVTTLACW